MLSSRILLFENTSLDALLVLYICMYGFYFLYCLCFFNTHVYSSLVEEIKTFIISVYLNKVQLKAVLCVFVVLMGLQFILLKFN